MKLPSTKILWIVLSKFGRMKVPERKFQLQSPLRRLFVKFILLDIGSIRAQFRE